MLLLFGLCGAVKMIVLGRPSHDVSRVGLGPRHLGPLLVGVSTVSARTNTCMLVLVLVSAVSVFGGARPERVRSSSHT